MLRKKLLTRLGLLVVMFVTGAVVSILLLQSVLNDIDADRQWAVVGHVQAVRESVDRLDAMLTAGRLGEPVDRAAVRASVERVGAAVSVLEGDALVKNPAGPGAAGIGRINQRLASLRAALAADAPASSDAVVSDASALHGELDGLTAAAVRGVSDGQASLSRFLRLLIIGLTIAALIATNVAIWVLVRTANMILNPVAALIEGSRELARERFGHRVSVRKGDEFEELAHAFNSLGEQLQANEERKVEALRQLAVSLNHEFNNVIAIIELRLKLLDRRAGDPSLRAQIEEIHQHLRRIAETIASLQAVRRVAVTSYMPGQLMLDLPRCIAPDETGAGAPEGAEAAR